VAWIDYAGRVTHKPHEHAGLRLAQQLFAKKGFANLFVKALFPGQLQRVDGKELRAPKKMTGMLTFGTRAAG